MVISVNPVSALLCKKGAVPFPGPLPFSLFPAGASAVSGRQIPQLALGLTDRVRREAEPPAGVKHLHMAPHIPKFKLLCHLGSLLSDGVILSEDVSHKED